MKAAENAWNEIVLQPVPGSGTPFNLSDFSALLADLRSLPFIFEVWVEDESQFLCLRDAVVLRVTFSSVDDKQGTYLRRVMDTIGRYESYRMVRVTNAM